MECLDFQAGALEELAELLFLGIALALVAPTGIGIPAILTVEKTI